VLRAREADEKYGEKQRRRWEMTLGRILVTQFICLGIGSDVIVVVKTVKVSFDSTECAVS
jgi:hypothetical protein